MSDIFTEKHGGKKSRLGYPKTKKRNVLEKSFNGKLDNDRRIEDPLKIQVIFSLKLV